MKHRTHTIIILLSTLCAYLQVEAVLTPTRVLQDGETTKAYVFDKIFSNRMLEVMSELVHSHSPWQFVHPDPYYGIETPFFGDLHWNAPFSPKAFKESLIWKALVKKLKGTGMLEGRGTPFFPLETHGIMLMRGFSPVVIKGASEGDVYIRVFLTKGMKKNDYSELNLYNKKDEIFGCVHPRFGRVAIWNDSADFLFKPPSMFFERAESSLLIKATTNKTKFEESQKQYEAYHVEKAKKSRRPFPFMNASAEDIPQINLTKHQTNQFFDSEKRHVLVFDNVVPKEELVAVRSWFLDQNSLFSYAPYDPDKSEEHDNVNWIVKMKENKKFTNSRIWKYIKHVLSYISKEDNWYPYDVAMNIIQHTHDPRIHSDCSPNEFEYTFLMYLSPEWQSERYGETIFVEKTDQPGKRAVKAKDVKYETLGAVVPKFGRIVVFRNIIDHSARPPSPDFLAARYTFAVKVGRSPEIAKAKTLREMLDLFLEDPAGKKLQENIFDGKYDKINDPKTDKFLNKKLKFYQEKQASWRVDDKEQSYKRLKFKQNLLL